MLVRAVTPRPEVRSYVPKSADQAIFVHRDKNALSLLQNANLAAFPQSMQDLVKTTDRMIATQDNDLLSMTPNDATLILFQVKDGFDPQGVLALLQSGNNDYTYTYKSIGKSVYVYGTPTALSRVSDSPLAADQQFLNQGVLSTYASQIADNQLSLVSLVDTAMVSQLDPVYQRALQNAKALVAMVHFDGDGETKLQADLIADTGYNIGADFNPKFGGYTSTDTIVMAEMGLSMQRFGLSSQDVTTGVQSLLASMGVDLPAASYTSLVNGLAHNRTIQLTKGQNIMGLGLILGFDTPDLYDFFAQLFPLVETQLSLATSGNTAVLPQGTVVQPLAATNTSSDDQRVGMQISLPRSGVTIPIDLLAQKKDNKTRLTLGDPVVSASESVVSKEPDDTLAYGFINFKPLVALYQQFGALASGATVQSSLPLDQLEKMKAQIQVRALDKVLRLEATFDEGK